MCCKFVPKSFTYIVLLTGIAYFDNQIEQLGSEGRVEEARGVTKLLDQLKEEREQVRNSAFKKVYKYI